jgi:hypothetical protein
MDEFKEFKEMEIGEFKEYDSISIVRVPGGILIQSFQSSVAGDRAIHTVYVPFSKS